MTERARTAFKDSFYEKTDPDLPDNERHRQADAAYRAHMINLSRRAALARRRAASAAQDAVQAEAEAIACSG